MANIPREQIVLQNAVTAAANGETLDITKDTTVVFVEISSTSTDANLNFEARYTGTTWQSINGVNLSDFSLGTTVSAVNGTYTVDVIGAVEFRARISDITTGAVTVTARAVG